MHTGRFGIGRDELPDLDAGPVDLRAWFANDANSAARPIDLEIGSGKGTFLVRQAVARPAVNYLGLELAKAYWRYTADRVRRHGLTNVRVVHGEAQSFVRYHLADRAIRQAHIYFPDPWPKKRHHKRRLIQPPFLRQLHRALADTDANDPEAGHVRIATDHADYFAWMEDAAAHVSDIFERLPFTSPEAAEEGEWVGTNYEKKFRDVHRVQGMILRKR